jgi:hypothetical protein
MLLATLNSVTTWRRIRRIRKCLLSIILLYPLDYSFVAVEKQLRREFSFRVAQSRHIFHQTVKQFAETGHLCDKRANGRKRSAYVRTLEVVGAAQGAVARSPRKASICCADRHTLYLEKHFLLGISGTFLCLVSVHQVKCVLFLDALQLLKFFVGTWTYLKPKQFPLIIL